MVQEYERRYFGEDDICSRCEGTGVTKSLESRWWQFWKLMLCPDCLGTGYKKERKK